LHSVLFSFEISFIPLSAGASFLGRAVSLPENETIRRIARVALDGRSFEDGVEMLAMLAKSVSQSLELTLELIIIGSIFSLIFEDAIREALEDPSFRREMVSLVTQGK